MRITLETLNTQNNSTGYKVRNTGHQANSHLSNNSVTVFNETLTNTRKNFQKIYYSIRKVVDHRH